MNEDSTGMNGKKKTFHLWKALRNYLNRRYPVSVPKTPTPSGNGLVMNDVFDAGHDRVYVRVAPTDRYHEVLSLVRAALEAKGVSFVRGRLTDDFLSAFVFSERDYSEAMAAILNVDFTAHGLEICVGNKMLTVDEKVLTTPVKEIKLFVTDQRMAVGGSDIISYCPIDLIFASLSADNARGENMLSITLVNPYVRRLRVQSFQELSSQSADLSETTELSMGAPSFPIDVVYTWVDDQDEAWKRERVFYAPKSTTAPSNADNRFKSRDEIRYSLRSIDMFAPFVRNVYIVTNGKFPNWLNRTNKRLICVSHRDIYQSVDDLPTFNSNSIETQLHHIDGLSEHFIYMNDDVFLGTFSRPDDFFLSNGSMKFYPSTDRLFPIDTRLDKHSWLSSNLFAAEMLGRAGIATSRFIMHHTPLSARRSISYALEEKFPAEWRTCASNKFRSVGDLNPIAFLGYQYGFSVGSAIPVEMKAKYIPLSSPYLAKQFAELLASRNCKNFCINDSGVAPEMEGMIDQQVENFLESYYPFKSSFEA